MQSKTDADTWQQELQSQIAELHELTAEIAECVQDENWEQLSAVLTYRQQCLEALFASYNQPEQRKYLKVVADSIIEQDSDFIATIQQQQKLLEQQIGAFDKGRLAVQAYNNS
ncbi:MAG: flagellar protein FliT [Methylococcales bacterium]